MQHSNFAPIDLHPIVLGSDPATNRADLMARLDEYCAGYSRVSQTGETILFHIARVAQAIEKFELHKPQYPSFTAFVKNEIISKRKISSGALWPWITAVKRLPNLKREQAARLGTERLHVLNRIVKNVRMRPSEIERLVREADNLSVDDLLDRFPELETITQPVRRNIQIPADRRTHSAWKKWIGDRDPTTVIEWCMRQHPILPDAKNLKTEV